MPYPKSMGFRFSFSIAASTLLFMHCASTSLNNREPSSVVYAPELAAINQLFQEYQSSLPFDPEGVPGDDEPSCVGFPKNLRTLFFTQFYLYALSKKGEVTPADAKRFSLRMGRVMATLVGKKDKEGEWKYNWVGESNGDSANIRDSVSGKSNDSRSSEKVGFLRFVLSNGERIISSHWDSDQSSVRIARVTTTLSRWRKMISEDVVPEEFIKPHVDAGILQISANQLVMDLDKNGNTVKPGLNFLAVHQGVFYPEEVSHIDGFLLGQEPNLGHVNRAYLDTYRAMAAINPDRAVSVCGTDMMFEDSQEALRKEMSLLARGDEREGPCQVCSPSSREDKWSRQKMNCNSEQNSKCFVKWVTLCPRLNIDIGMSVTEKYFGTKELDSVEYQENGLPIATTAYGNGSGNGRCFLTLRKIAAGLVKKLSDTRK